jgi:hypothetical protein
MVICLNLFLIVFGFLTIGFIAAFAYLFSDVRHYQLELSGGFITLIY